MKNIIFPLLFWFCISSCKKSDKFYETLKAIPQINFSNQYAYKLSYVTGDTMVITGSFKPVNNIEVKIGGVSATILKTDSINYQVDNATTAYMDQLYVLISPPMEGLAREVKVTNGAYSTTGSSVDIYGVSGSGSFSTELTATSIKTFTNSQNVFFYCVNGKGDIYYYDATTKDIRHILKDGTEDVVYDLSKSLEAGSSVLVNTVLAGGVDPQGQFLYCSVRTNTGYRFLQIDLGTKQLTTLNQSTNVASPYEGALGTVKMIVTGVYPDAKGNLYLGVGTGLLNYNTAPDAVAYFDKAKGMVTYLYKGFQGSGSNNFPAMPGIKIETNTVIGSLRFSPDENLLYVLGLAPTNASGVEVFDLKARVKIQELATSNATGSDTRFNVVAPFSGLRILMNATNPDLTFGYLPMPGKRLQTLLYQFVGLGKNNEAARFGFPKWIVFDFNEKRSYAYAPGKFNQGDFIFQPTGNLSPRSISVDALLNYDEDGNLYMTTNGKTVLIKTQAVH